VNKMNHSQHGFGDAFRPQLSPNLQGFFKTNLEALGGKEGHEDQAQAVNEEGRSGYPGQGERCPGQSVECGLGHFSLYPD